MTHCRAMALACVAVLGTASSAQAFEIKTTDTGEPVRWPSASVSVAVAVAPGQVQGGVAACRTAIEAAFESWEIAVERSLAFRPSTATGGPPAVGPRDGDSVVHWIESGWESHYDFDRTALAMTLTTYDARTGDILESDILINLEHHDWTADAAAPSGCERAFDLRSVLTHEVGHFIGLSHERTDTTAAMYPGSSPCETAKRVLSSDDIAGANALYGGGAQLDPTEASLAGCGVTGSRTSGAAMVFAVLALVWAGRRRRIVSAVVVSCTVALGAAASGASTLTYVGPTELSQGAHLVVQGTVVSQRAVAAGDMIYTESLVAVSSCWAGACPDRVVIRQLGGELHGRGLAVEGTARLVVGDDIVAFLAPTRDRAAHRVVGMANGVYHVSAGWAERDLRGAHVVGTPPTANLVERIRVPTLRAAVQAATALRPHP